MAGTGTRVKIRTTQTLAEEVVNAITHGVGAALAAAGIALLVTAAANTGDTARIVAVAIYGSTLFLLYLCSTLYHAFPRSRVKEVFGMLDHCAIFLLIAGTYTPFILILLSGPLKWVAFGVVWGLAIYGIVFKIVTFYLGHGDRYTKLMVLKYLGLGWLGLIWVGDMIDAADPAALVGVLIGGIFYSAGVVFYLWERLPYNHAVWHLFVLVASTVHFLSVLLYVVPSAAA